MVNYLVLKVSLGFGSLMESMENNKNIVKKNNVFIFYCHDNLKLYIINLKGIKHQLFWLCILFEMQ